MVAHMKTLSGYQTLSPYLLSLAAVTALLYSGWSFQSFIGHKQRDNIPSIASSPDADVPQISQLDEIAAASPFGEGINGAYDAQVASSDLRVVGIFINGVDKPGAVISYQGEKEVFYQEGDTLPGNLTLHKVLPRKLILLHNGQQETLFFMGDGEL